MFRRREKKSLPDRMREAIWPKMGWRRVACYWGHRIGRVPGTPYGIAAGFACGGAIAMTPFMGVHLVLAIGLAWLIRGSIAASILGSVMFGNPLTWPVILLVTHRLGCLVLRIPLGTGGPHIVSWQTLGHNAWAMAAPMTVGGVLVAVVLWPLMFLTLRPLIARYKHHRIAASHQFAHHHHMMAAGKIPSQPSGEDGR